MKLNVAIKGKGGYGVKKLAGVVITAVLLENEDFSVASGQEYDAAVRGGVSNSYLMIADKPILNPAFEAADIVIDLTNLRIVLPQTVISFENNQIAKQQRGAFLIGAAAGMRLWFLKSASLERALQLCLRSAYLDKSLAAFRQGVAAAQFQQQSNPSS